MTGEAGWMFLRFTPVLCIIALFLVYALSPLTSAYPGPLRLGAARAPLVRLLLLDIVATLAIPPEVDDPAPQKEQPTEVLLTKQHAVLRKLATVIVPATIAPSLPPGQQVQETPAFACRPLQKSERSRLAGARLQYFGLSPPA